MTITGMFVYNLITACVILLILEVHSNVHYSMKEKNCIPNVNKFINVISQPVLFRNNYQHYLFFFIYTLLCLLFQLKH